MELTKKQFSEFQQIIYDYYKVFGRPFAWRIQNTTPRANITPYHIFVSEVMLQQTQTKRVTPKYEAFIKRFPTWQALANAPQFDLLETWQGLGYNRRALSLQKSALIITKEHGGVVPENPEELIRLPGIGKATAASIPAFAYNKPTVFVETNIRVVFFHFFLQEQENISDNEILDLVEQTLDRENPRAWYYALMDYGVMLKAQGINPINKSKHYHKQSKFKGSDREIRGTILKILLKENGIQEKDLFKKLEKKLQATPERSRKIIQELLEEKFLHKKDGYLFI